MNKSDRADAATRVLVITGMSGAGKSSVLRALEDQGYEAIDNLPLNLLETLVDRRGEPTRPVAIGVDIRTRDFGAAALGREIDRLKATPGVDATLVFVDCDDETLGRRFTETRRRHPLALDRPLADGVRDERLVLSTVRDRADVILDTTTYNLADLRGEIADRFAAGEAGGLSVIVVSFSYARGLPRGADLVFDVRFLRNPHYDADMRPLTGRDPEVGAYIAGDAGFDSFFDNLCGFVLPLIPRFEREGKSYLTLAVGCTGGRHRSVYVAERLAGAISADGRTVTVRHRDLDLR